MNDDQPPGTEGARASIIAAAHRLFMAHGFHGTSMRRIAQEAGIALGSIYNHFESKEAVFLAVLFEHHPFIAVLPVMNAAQGETTEAYVRDAARRMVAQLYDRSDFLNLIFIELVEFDSVHLPLIFEKFLPEIMAFGNRCFNHRAELKDLPTPLLVRAFIGLFFSYVMTELIMGKHLPSQINENALEQFIDIFLHGIIKEGYQA
jgi:AcrR family transcriptional regulator